MHALEVGDAVNDHWGWSCADCNTTNGHLQQWCVVCGTLRPESVPDTAGVLRGAGPDSPPRSREVLVAAVVLLALAVIGIGAFFLARNDDDGDARGERTPNSEPTVTTRPADGSTTLPDGTKEPVVAWLYPSRQYSAVAAAAADVSAEGYRSGTVVAFDETPRSTIVYFRDDETDTARAVAELLGLSTSSIQRVPGSFDAPVAPTDDVIVVLGQDWIDEAGGD